MTHDYYRRRTFATVYDDAVVVLPIAHPETLDGGELGDVPYNLGASTARNGCRRLERLTDASEQLPLQL
ncbi:MAG: hypothetical protein E7Z99_04390 [Coriobacteriaceae bacterium]|nr:hypothetical protein [Coriobacteriaceae bacterium]